MFKFNAAWAVAVWMGAVAGLQLAKHFVQLRQCQQCLVRGEIGLPLNLITATLPLHIGINIVEDSASILHS